MRHPSESQRDQRYWWGNSVTELPLTWGNYLTAHTGATGQTAVEHRFLQLGWGVAPNPVDQDLGTDLWLMARDARRFDLQALVGAQVKTGMSFFGSPKFADDGTLEGWWFAESSTDHFKYWSEHNVPHILVLHDLESALSYWVHITGERIVSTGKGAKILVPVGSTLDEAHLDELLGIAGGERRLGSWDGSAWNTDRTILDGDRLRHALITPRLVAPHPNLTVTALDPAQAIALLIKMRIEDLTPTRGLLKHSAAPVLDECRASEVWAWRFYAALHDVIVNGAQIETLVQLIPETEEPSERAAVLAIVAALLVEAGMPMSALEHIADQLEQDSCGPVDHAWLQIHQARSHAELGNLADAHRFALQAQGLRTTAPGDPTAMAIAGAGADLILATSEIGGRDIPGAVAGRDTTAAWWRTQEIAWGLQDEAEIHFERWTKGTDRADASVDGPWRRLRSATLIAGVSGDHTAWRYTSSLLAKHMLMTAGDDAARITSALRALRAAGDTSAIRNAVPRLLETGPTSAVVQATTGLSLDESTRTSIGADIELITSAADVVPTDEADRQARWALTVLDNPEPLYERLSPAIYLPPVLLRMLAQLALALSADGLRTVTRHLTTLPPQEDHPTAVDYARLVAQMPATAWTADDLRALAQRSDNSFELADEFEVLLAAADPYHRRQLQTRIASGDLRALRIFGDVRDLDAETVIGLIAWLRERITVQIDELRKGVNSIGAHSFAGTVALINVCTRSMLIGNQWRTCSVRR